MWKYAIRASNSFAERVTALKSALGAADVLRLLALAEPDVDVRCRSGIPGRADVIRSSVTGSAQAGEQGRVLVLVVARPRVAGPASSTAFGSKIAAAPVAREEVADAQHRRRWRRRRAPRGRRAARRTAIDTSQTTRPLRGSIAELALRRRTQPHDARRPPRDRDRGAACERSPAPDRRARRRCVSTDERSEPARGSRDDRLARRAPAARRPTGGSARSCRRPAPHGGRCADQRATPGLRAGDGRRVARARGAGRHGESRARRRAAQTIATTAAAVTRCDPAPQTSTTTGRTIGRRRRRS